LDLIAQQLNGSTAISDVGLDISQLEFDLLIVILVTILKAITYKVLRQQFIQKENFLKLIVRFLYNQPRPGDDKTRWNVRNKKEQKEEPVNQTPVNQTPDESKRPGIRKASAKKQKLEEEEKAAKKLFTVKSGFEDAEKRAIHVLEAIADIITDIMMFSEESCVEKIKNMKF
jgi:hypothetical protein